MTEHQSETIRRRRRPKLTDLMVAGLPKKRKRYILADPEMGGLYVRVPSEGANVFCAVARRPKGGKQVWATIGNSEILKVEEAREKARAAIKRIKAGLSPFEALPVTPDSFESVAENWFKRHVVNRSE